MKTDGDVDEVGESCQVEVGWRKKTKVERVLNKTEPIALLPIWEIGRFTA